MSENWRQPIVEAVLILLYTVELMIPVYNDKNIIVVFNVFPLSSTEHVIYRYLQQLRGPKPLLQILLFFASCLTLLKICPFT